MAFFFFVPIGLLASEPIGLSFLWRPIMRSLTTALILALAVPAWAQVPKQERPGIVNFSKVDAVVACGGATETSALEGLAKDGFKSVINLRLATENNANIDQNAAKAKELGLKYIHIPFSAQQ